MPTYKTLRNKICLRYALKIFKLLAQTTFSGKSFQYFTTLLVKNSFLTFILEKGISNFKELPLVRVLVDQLKKIQNLNQLNRKLFYTERLYQNTNDDR